MPRTWLAPAIASTLGLLLSACAGGPASGRYVSTGNTAAPAPSAPSPAFRAPQVMRAQGVDSIIGQAAGSLARRFGEARLDVAEGDARKLQFVSDGCVLDIYLYPLEAGRAPVATHVEARVRQGGGATDRAACIEAIERASSPR